MINFCNNNNLIHPIFRLNKQATSLKVKNIKALLYYNNIKKAKIDTKYLDKNRKYIKDLIMEQTIYNKQLYLVEIHKSINKFINFFKNIIICLYYLTIKAWTGIIIIK